MASRCAWTAFRITSAARPQRWATNVLIRHLKSLGITALQLLPVHALVQDRVLVEQGLVNYWGYNTLSWFAPEPRYLAEWQLRRA